MYRPFYIDEENIESKKSKFPMVEPKKQSEQQEVKPKEVKKKDSDNNYKLDLTSMIDGGTSIALSSAPKQQKDSKKKTTSSNTKKRKIVEVSMADKDN